HDAACAPPSAPPTKAALSGPLTSRPSPAAPDSPPTNKTHPTPPQADLPHKEIRSMSLASTSRRAFLSVGVIGGLRLTLGDYFRLQAAAPPSGDKTKGKGKEPPAQSVIHIFLPGGIAHQELVDPKPLAPVEYRGDMGSIKTRLPGVFFNECMKKTAQIADKITVCRSMTHGDAAHEL